MNNQFFLWFAFVVHWSWRKKLSLTDLLKFSSTYFGTSCVFRSYDMFTLLVIIINLSFVIILSFHRLCWLYWLLLPFRSFSEFLLSWDLFFSQTWCIMWKPEEALFRYDSSFHLKILVDFSSFSWQPLSSNSTRLLQITF